MTGTYNDLGDLIRALKRLNPQDEATRIAIASMLGIGWLAEVPDDDTEFTDDERITTRPESQAPLPEPDAEQPKESPVFDGDGLPPRLTPLSPTDPRRSPMAQPRWLETSKALPVSTREERPPQRAIEPLLEPVRTRAILAEVLTNTSNDGSIDISTLISQIISGSLIDKLPRLPRRTFGFGTEILVDRSVGMTPFFADQDQLVSRIRTALGDESTCVSRFCDSPLRVTHSGIERDWTPPNPCRPILALTDFGIGNLPLGYRAHRRGGTGRMEHWRRVGWMARESGCSLIALVPYPSRRWPGSLRDMIHMLPWQRSLNVRIVRQLLRHQRVETG